MKKEIDGKIYWENAQGSLVAEELIKDIDKARDSLVREFVGKAQTLQGQMQDFKSQVFDDVAAFVSLSAEKYGVKMVDRKGNLTLHSFDGKYKMQVAVNDNVRFDERIHAAKELIDECLHEWSENARSELRSIIDNAFQVDKEGNLSTAKILSLRFYQRDSQGKYQPISLDMANV